MEFSFICPCGRTHAVSANQAGAELLCDCGVTSIVPPLGELRKASGLAAYDASVSDSLRHQFAVGELDIGDSCVECGKATNGVLPVEAVCEQSCIHGSGGAELTIFGIPVARTEGRAEERGRDTTVPLPIRMCSDCVMRMFRPRLMNVLRLARGLSLILVVAILVLEYAEPLLPFTVLGRLSLVPVGFVVLLWLIETFFSSGNHAKLKAAVRKVAPYEELLCEHPDTEFRVVDVGAED